STSGTKKTEFEKSQNETPSGGGPLIAGGSPLSPRPKHIMVNKVKISIASDDEVERFYKPVLKPEICLGIDLERNEWIKDSGCSKHMTGNQKLFSTYKAYNREHVDNLGFKLLSAGQICDSKCKVIFSKHDREITKDRKIIGRGICKRGLCVMKLGKKPEDKICLAMIDETQLCGIGD
ncbi:hypothetical protein Tco_1071891, partial [Tanacetum coccineum]